MIPTGYGPDGYPIALNVTNAGISGANGTYTRNGNVSDDRPEYAFSIYTIVPAAMSRWGLIDTLNLFYTSDTSDLLGVWSAQIVGDNPPPTVTAV